MGSEADQDRSPTCITLAAGPPDAAVSPATATATAALVLLTSGSTGTTTLVACLKCPSVGMHSQVASIGRVSGTVGRAIQQHGQPVAVFCLSPRVAPRLWLTAPYRSG